MTASARRLGKGTPRLAGRTRLGVLALLPLSYMGEQLFLIWGLLSAEIKSVYHYVWQELNF